MKNRFVKRTWLVGGLIYSIVIYLLIIFIPDEVNAIAGQYSMQIFDALAAILLFTFLFTKNGIKVSTKALRTPGKDLIAIVLVTAVFVLLYFGLGPTLSAFLSGFTLEILPFADDSIGFTAVVLFFVYLTYALTGIVVSLVALPIVKRILKPKKN